MSCWALVAVKARSERKARLAGRLSPAERDRLTDAMLQDVLAALHGSRLIDGIAVVTAEPGPFDSQVLVLADSGTGLNDALTSAAGDLQGRGATQLLVLHGDLPFVTAAEIDELVTVGRQTDVALAPDRGGIGTNALFLALPSQFRFCFGENSYTRHCEEAALHGLATRTIRLPGLEVDVDEPADLPELEQRGGTSYTFLSRGRHAERSRPVKRLQACETGRLGRSEALELVSASAGELVGAAEALTLRGHGRAVSYSRKVFIPLTQLCRDVCRYCTFAQVPVDGTPAYLSPQQVLDVARAGAAAGCKEALFTLGDKPELRYRAARAALAELGCATTLEYVEKMARLVHEETGLLVHLNPGVMSAEEIARLRPVAVSMGMMLESASARLCERGGPHWGCPDKVPAVRLATIRAAGEQGVAFTSGLLIGIGETREERVESLLALRDLHDAHGHLQEIIIQNFRAKPGTVMAEAPEPPLEEHLWSIAAARLIFGPSMSIQAPPNLRAGELAPLIRAGINDWGGVSPVTPDHVNPEAPWPHIDALASATEAAGRHLVERLALTPACVQTLQRWVDPALQAAVLRQADAFGRARDAGWHAGMGNEPPAATAAWVRTGQPSDAVAPEIRQVLRRAAAGRGLTEEEVVRLFDAQGPDLHAVLGAADRLRRESVGDAVSYVVNCNINYTNICTHRCGFCAFAKGRSAASLRGPGYNLGPDEVAMRAVEAWQRGATEVCLQGGIHPEYTGRTYLDIVRAVKRAVPQMHVHAFSPLEVRHGAQSLGLSLRDYLRELQAAGLATLPGTAAEILDDEVRAVICPDKLDTGQWLEVIGEAHALGLRTTATIMFGHVDRPVHWARHLARIRQLQEQTGGITEFVPLPFVHLESPLWRRGRARSGPTLREAVLMHAVARLALHPLIRNIQTSWVKMGPRGAQLCLQAGANDLGGTLMYESITRAAGGVNGQEFDAAAMAALAAGIGRPAWQRTTLYGRATIEAGRQQAVIGRTATG